MKKNEVQSYYEAAVIALNKYCENETDLVVVILDEDYPFRVQFLPDPQQTIFGNENVSEDGEINDLTVTVGLTTTVKSTLKFKMNSKQLKKLIKLAEKLGYLYYQAFRAGQDDRSTPKRPGYEGDGYADGCLVYDTAYCPECRHSFEEGVNDWGSAFCPDCGQALDWSHQPAEDQTIDEGEQERNRFRDLCAEHEREAEKPIEDEKERDLHDRLRQLLADAEGGKVPHNEDGEGEEA